MTTEELRTLLPQSVEAEMGVLAALMNFPKQAGATCAERKITAGHFHLHPHRILYESIIAAWANSDPIDLITVSDRLKAEGTLDKIGGHSYLSLVFTTDVNIHNLPHHLEILEDKHLLRQIYTVATEFRNNALSHTEGLGALLEFQQAVAGIMVPGDGKEKTFNQLLQQALESIENGEDGIADIMSGIQALDKVVRMRNGNFIVIAGEAKSGKTALAGNIMTHAAIRQGKRCALFSLEMTGVESVKRFISSEGKVNLSMMGRTPAEHEMRAIERGGTALHKRDIEIEDQLYDLGAIVAKARRWHAKRPIHLLMVDYLQLVEGSTRKEGTRQEAVAQISRTFKRLAGELGCVVVGLSQLNDDGKLRESRAIGQDANTVMVVEKEEDGGRRIYVAAQRSGESGVAIPVQWLPQFTKFQDQ